MSEIDPLLAAEYRDPLRYLDDQSYKNLRRSYVWRALGFIVVGFAFMALMLLPGSGPSSPGIVKGNFATTLLGFGLPLYGLNQLLHMKRNIMRIRRAELVWLHPELQAFEPTRKIKQLPPLRRRIIIDVVIIIVVLVTAVTLWALSLSS
jgi:hypothetical protein